MTTQNFFILTPAQRTTAMGLDDDGNVEIDPRAVDNSSPGVGLNLNDNALDYDPGQSVPLTGNFLAPKLIVDDPEYQSNCPGLITFLLTLPFALLEPETVFAPPS